MFEDVYYYNKIHKSERSLKQKEEWSVVRSLKQSLDTGFVFQSDCDDYMKFKKTSIAWGMLIFII